MTLVLLYLVVLILIAIVLFALGSVFFGRGEPLPPLPRDTTATVLPASGVTGADVDAIKFSQTLRGYKISEVDWVLDRLGRNSIWCAGNWPRCVRPTGSMTTMPTSTASRVARTRCLRRRQRAKSDRGRSYPLCVDR